jgi:hypothetical protein
MNIVISKDIFNCEIWRASQTVNASGHWDDDKPKEGMDDPELLPSTLPCQSFSSDCSCIEREKRIMRTPDVQPEL